MQGHISKWGNSSGVRLPTSILAKSGLKQGEVVEFSAEEGRIVLEAPKPKQKKYTMKELLANTTPEAMRTALDPEFHAYWQSSVGREIIED